MIYIIKVMWLGNLFMEGEGTQGKPRGENLVKEQELPERDLFRLLAAIGNHEAKCLTLIAMGNGHIFSQSDLCRTILGHQGGRVGWRMNSSLPFHYCEDSLSPIGLVAKEAINPDLTVYGYQITEYGKQTGIPLAGLLLKWSLEHPDFSLYKMFASTASSAQREEPCQNILFIIDQLSGNTARAIHEKLRITYDSMIRLNSVSYYLKELIKQGKLVVEPTKAGNTYRLPEPTPKT